MGCLQGELASGEGGYESINAFFLIFGEEAAESAVLNASSMYLLEGVEWGRGRSSDLACSIDGHKVCEA